MICDFCIREDVQGDSIVGLLDAGLFLHLLLAGTTLHLSWSFGLRLFRVFHTEVSSLRDRRTGN